MIQIEDEHAALSKYKQTPSTKRNIALVCQCVSVCVSPTETENVKGKCWTKDIFLRQNWVKKFMIKIMVRWVTTHAHTRQPNLGEKISLRKFPFHFIPILIHSEKYFSLKQISKWKFCHQENCLFAAGLLTQTSDLFAQIHVIWEDPTIS